MEDFGAYPFPSEGYDLYGYDGDLGLEDLGQTPTQTPTVPAVVSPAPGVIQKVESFLRTPFGFLLVVGGGLFLAHRFGYLDLKKIFQTEESD